jgi:hypothetical protein
MGFDAVVRLVLETSCALFSNCVDEGGASVEEVDAAQNRLMIGDFNKLHNWYFAMHARVAEDLAVIN